MPERIVSLEDFNRIHIPPTCTVIGKTVILNSDKENPADGLPEPEFHPEGKTCLNHQVSGVNFVKPQPPTSS